MRELALKMSISINGFVATPAAHHGQPHFPRHGHILASIDPRKCLRNQA